MGLFKLSKCSKEKKLYIISQLEISVQASWGASQPNCVVCVCNLVPTWQKLPASHYTQSSLSFLSSRVLYFFFFWRQTNSKFTLYCRIECWLKLLLHKSSICSFTKFWRSLHFCKALLPVAWKSGDATLVLEMETRYPTLLPPMQWFEENCRYQFLVYCYPSGVNREVIVENGIFELLYKGFMSSEEPSNWNKFVLRHFCKYLSLSIDVNVP